MSDLRQHVNEIDDLSRKDYVCLLKRIQHPDYNNELTQFLPRTVVLKKPPGAQLGFNIRGGKASQLGIFISKVIEAPWCLFMFCAGVFVWYTSILQCMCLFDRWSQTRMLIEQDYRRETRFCLSMRWTFKTLNIRG